jgi:hypothetical protein
MIYFLLFILVLIGMYEINKIINKTSSLIPYIENFKLVNNLEGGYVYDRYTTLPSNWNDNLEYNLNPNEYRKRFFYNQNPVQPHNIDIENDGILTYTNFTKQTYPSLNNRPLDWKCQRPWFECAFYPPELNKVSPSYTLGEPVKFNNN